MVLIERVRIVQPIRKPRLKSKLYAFGVFLLTPLVALVIMMLLGASSPTASLSASCVVPR